MIHYTNEMNASYNTLGIIKNIGGILQCICTERSPI